MDILLKNIAQRTPEICSCLLGIWRDSVTATHHFLTEVDRENLTPLVRKGLEDIPTLVTAEDAHGAVLGFMGIAGDSLEMLFLAPQHRGRGTGRRLVTHALQRHGVVRVDVNEQNPDARGFYEHMGFVIVGRSPRDGQGNPFPLLHMHYALSAHA